MYCQNCIPIQGLHFLYKMTQSGKNHWLELYIHLLCTAVIFLGHCIHACKYSSTSVLQEIKRREDAVSSGNLYDQD